MPSIELYRSLSTSSSQKLEVGDTIKINTEIVKDSSTFYRTIIYLSIPKDDIATNLAFKSSIFKGSFSKDLLTIPKFSSHLNEPWKIQEGKVLVNLKRPWHIHRINTVNTNTIDLFRIDGEAIADEATVEATTGQDINPEFVSNNFAMIITSSITTTSSFSIVSEGTDEITLKSGSLSEETFGGGDISFDTKNTSSDKSIGDLTSEAIIGGMLGINSVVLNSYPTSPRFYLPTDINEQNPTADSALDSLWQEAGELRTTAESDVGSLIKEALSNKLPDLIKHGTLVDNHWFVPIIIESDTPCQWTLDQFDLSVNYVIDKFSDESDKHQIKFDGVSLEPQPLPLTIPTGTIIEASIKIDIGNQENISNPADTDLPHRNVGLTVDETHWVATKIAPDRAGFYNAASLLISLLTPEAKLSVSLLDGNTDVFSKPLVETTVTLTQDKQKNWYTIRFNEIRLDAVPYWLVLKVPSGKIIWLGEKSPKAISNRISNTTSVVTTAKNIQPTAQLLPANNNVSVNLPLFQLSARGSALDIQQQSNSNFYDWIFPGTLSADSVIRVTQASKGLLSFSGLYIKYE